MISSTHFPLLAACLCSATLTAASAADSGSTVPAHAPSMVYGPPSPNAPSGGEDESKAVPVEDTTVVAQRVDELEQRFARLQGQLRVGTGAYASNTGMRLDGGSSETLLERLRRLETAATTARAEADAHAKQVTVLEQELTASRLREARLQEQIDSLDHVRDNLTTAQQELGDRQNRIDEAAKQLAAAQMARLVAEQQYYTLLGSLLKLQPGQTQDLIELQNRARRDARALEPAGETAATPGSAK